MSIYLSLEEAIIILFFLYINNTKVFGTHYVLEVQSNIVCGTFAIHKYKVCNVPPHTNLYVQRRMLIVLSLRYSLYVFRGW